MLRAPHPLSREQLEKLSTQRLLQVLKVARRAELGLWCPCCNLPRWEVDKCLTEAEWKREKEEADFYLSNIKAVLATREHVERHA
jgi:hypothetical protein